MSDLRVLNIPRETRDQLQAGSVFIRQVASDFAAELDPHALLDCADAVDLVVAEWDAGEGEAS